MKESITGRDSVVREALEGKSAHICAVSFNASFVDSVYFIWSRNSFCISCVFSVLSWIEMLEFHCSLLSLDTFHWFLILSWHLQCVCGMANSSFQQDFFYSIWWDDVMVSPKLSTKHHEDFCFKCPPSFPSFTPNQPLKRSSKIANADYIASCHGGVLGKI